jgi:hypothetical protein
LRYSLPPNDNTICLIDNDFKGNIISDTTWIYIL